LIFFKIGPSPCRRGQSSLTTSRSVSGISSDQTAALVSSHFRFGDRWYLETNAGAIRITLATSLQGSFRRRRSLLSRKFGLEAGYGVTGVKITVDKEGSGSLFEPTIKGSIKYPYQDFRLGVVAAFQ
jgi:hypothetical protein